MDREDRVKFLAALDFDLFIARFGGSRGDPYANQKKHDKLRLRKKEFIRNAIYRLSLQSTVITPDAVYTM